MRAPHRPWNRHVAEFLGQSAGKRARRSQDSFWQRQQIVRKVLIIHQIVILLGLKKTRFLQIPALLYLLFLDGSERLRRGGGGAVSGKSGRSIAAVTNSAGLLLPVSGRIPPRLACRSSIPAEPPAFRNSRRFSRTPPL